MPEEEVYEERRRKRHKRKKYRINRLRFSIFIITLIVILVFGAQVVNIVKLRQEQAELKSTNKELKQKVADMNDELKSIDDKNYIEQKARQELKMVKPGEKLYIIDNSDPDSGN